VDATPSPYVERWQGDVDLIGLAARHPERYPGLFSTRGDVGWDILFACPRDITRIADSATLAAHPAMSLCPAGCGERVLPFTGGWLAFAAYEFGGALEPSVVMHDAGSTPMVWLARIPAAVLVERATGAVHLVAEAGEETCLDTLRADLAAESTPLPAWQAPNNVVEDEPGAYLDGIRRIKDYIRAGDVFQVNYSRAWRAQSDAVVSPATLFARLAERNPAPFSALLDLGGQAVVSSSPERLFRIEQGRILTRPIAGTHPRHDDPEEDAAQRERLIAHPKERAEHIMLVDLERNDLGRVCEPGSVTVDALMDVASYRHVHHIESTVTGRLRGDATLYDVLRALFPGGTITGCPKVRTMQIIAELEAAPRRAYTGSLGYINRDGGADFNILIRSFWVDGDSVEVRAGAGIVADSDPERELAETRAKALGLLRALEE